MHLASAVVYNPRMGRRDGGGNQFEPVVVYVVHLCLHSNILLYDKLTCPVYSYVHLRTLHLSYKTLSARLHEKLLINSKDLPSSSVIFIH